MDSLFDLSCEEAKAHLLKGSSYFKQDLPDYISFEPILTDVAAVLGGRSYSEFKSAYPGDLPDVNYSLVSNKDGRLAWRPLELIHPAIYVSLVNLICEPTNWGLITKRLSEFEGGAVHCCSAPIRSCSNEKDAAGQVRNWWETVEQRSLVYSLEFSHVLHSDVIDCYGSLYTHSIPWAIHGLKEAKKRKGKGSLLGDRIDSQIRAGRYGQTNGISQGSVLMDLVAEIVLGYVDEQITRRLAGQTGFRVPRYRDDYRIFANSDDQVEAILKEISDTLRAVGMSLGVAKTRLCRNVVEGSIKPDKLAGVELQDLGDTNATTIQKQLLRLHAFGQRFPNSGALRRLLSDFTEKLRDRDSRFGDLAVQVAIATDIGFVSPDAFPAVATILSLLISRAPTRHEKCDLWEKVRRKMSRVPYNGYLEIWLQRVTHPRAVGIKYDSNESICRIVNREPADLWNNAWISCSDLKDALDGSNIRVGSVSDIDEVVQPEEIELFRQYAWTY